MSVWHEKTENHALVAQSCDVVFKIKCVQLPVDHATALASAILCAAPWLSQVDNAGIHSIHVAGSQNGWERPNADDGEKLILSKRTRLRIRVPKSKASELIDTLSDQTLMIDDEPLSLLSGTSRDLLPAETLFSRACNFSDDSKAFDETIFIDNIIAACEKIGFSPNKILCGKSLQVRKADDILNCRSVMLADVPTEYSLPLQDAGLGQSRLLGCGLLLPHKDTAAVH